MTGSFRSNRRSSVDLVTFTHVAGAGIGGGGGSSDGRSRFGCGRLGRCGAKPQEQPHPVAVEAGGGVKAGDSVIRDIKTRIDVKGIRIDIRIGPEVPAGSLPKGRRRLGRSLRCCR